MAEYQLIQSHTFTSAQPGVLFSNIPQNYKNIIGVVLGASDSTVKNLTIRLNGVTSGHGRQLRGSAGGAGVYSYNSGTNTYMIGSINGAGFEALPYVGMHWFEIYDYTSSTKPKTVSVHCTDGNTDFEIGKTFSPDISPTTSIEVGLSIGSSYQVGTKIALFGLGGQ